MYNVEIVVLSHLYIFYGITISLSDSICLALRKTVAAYRIGGNVVTERYQFIGFFITPLISSFI